jgi:hypothetical protein
MDSLIFCVCRVEPSFVMISFEPFRFFSEKLLVISDSAMMTLETG